ncbi:MAG: cytochrome-c oxidase, cbb3-type subunit III [Alphaproteobacteria bacterium]|nr:cytochrome-c oxidase, cbb3-type subunit III [Alphaproteobacteria bacterium]
MPTKIEKDSVTGTDTTGHEWDGVRELNTPLPTWWVYTFYATIVWAIAYYIVYPAWPGLSGYTKGIWSYSQRVEVEADIAQARAAQKGYRDRVGALSTDDIRKDPDLLAFALAGGRAAFADNCVPCHAVAGAGRIGYPSLADDDWLWGGTLAEIQRTIEVGARSGHAETRVSDMPRFGADGMLTGPQIDDLAEFVLQLSGRGDAAMAASAERGRPLYAENCAACHGDSGEGKPDVGAPRLNDQIWLYGGDKQSIVASINAARAGVMPAWAGRLDVETIKMLTVYVHSLGGGR